MLIAKCCLVNKAPEASHDYQTDQTPEESLPVQRVLGERIESKELQPTEYWGCNRILKFHVP